MPLLLSELMRKYSLLSTGRQPDSLAPVWALIGHLTHTHTHRGLCSAARLHLARRVCEEDPARYFKVISCRSLTFRILWEF